MKTGDIANEIQFIVDGRGNVTSVVLSLESWQRLAACLEDAEDREFLSRLAPRLAQGPKDALRWNEVGREWA
ncbi:MAG: hypothetical protein IT372_03030 [Polyangiaceae bacterium]|nr:hypothetical protein [Polyangiaceae bacterium]